MGRTASLSALTTRRTHSLCRSFAKPRALQVGEQFLARLKAFARIAGKHSIQNQFEFRGHVGIEQARGLVLPDVLETHDFAMIVAGKRHLSRDEMVKKHAKAVDIRSLGGRFAAEQFWRHEYGVPERLDAFSATSPRSSMPAPKSVRRIRPPSSLIAFWVFTSRWMTPARCTAARARQSSMPMSDASRCAAVYSWPPSNCGGITNDSVDPTLEVMEKNCSASAKRLPSS